MRPVALWVLLTAFTELSAAQLFPNSTAKIGNGNGTSLVAANASMVSSTSVVELTSSSIMGHVFRSSVLPSGDLLPQKLTSTSGSWTNTSSLLGPSTFNSSGLRSTNTTRPPYPANGTSTGGFPTAVNFTLISKLNLTSAVHNATNSTATRPSSAPLYRNSTSSRFNASATNAPFLNATATLSPSNVTTTTKNACQQSFEDQQNSYFDFVPTTLTESLNTWILEYDNTTYSTEIYSCTKSCGSICYAGPVTTIISTTHVYSERTYTYQTYSRPFTTALNCTIPYDECIELQSSYTSASDYYWTSMPLDEAASGEPIRPYCSACKSTTCTFEQPYMELYYWPTSAKTTRDYCATAPAVDWASDYIPDINHTYVPITTGTYAVVDGITMYQGNVYVSYGEPGVVDNCGQYVSRKNTKTRNLVVTLASDAIYSIRSYPHILAPWPVTWDLKPYPVNYDDFHDPVPWSAWNGMRECAQEGAPQFLCTPVKQASDYQPYMLMPPQIRDLDPAWKDCKFDYFAAYDPPIALQPANMFSSSTIVVANPTPTGDAEPERTPATPGQNGGGWLPVVTAGPTKPQSPPDWDDVREPVVAKPPINSVQNGPSPTGAPTSNAPVDLPIEGITVGSSVMPVDSGGGLIVQPGLTLRPNGKPAEIDSTTFSIISSSLIIIDSRGTSSIPLPQTHFPQSPITISASTFPIDPSGNVLLQPGVPGITLTSNGNALNINGTMMSIGPAGMILTHNSQTSTIPMPTHNTPQTALTIGTQTYPLAPSGGLILHSPQTLLPSSQLIVSRTTYSLSSTGLIVIDSYGAKTYSFKPAEKQYFTVGTQTYTLVNGKLILGAHLTLSGPGGMAVFGGTTVMLRSESVVVESRGRSTIVGIRSKSWGQSMSQGVGETRKSGGGRRVKIGIRGLVAGVLGILFMVI